MKNLKYPIPSALPANGSITNPKLFNMPGNTVKGRLTSAGEPQDLSADSLKTLLGTGTSAAVISNLNADLLDGFHLKWEEVSESGNVNTVLPEMSPKEIAVYLVSKNTTSAIYTIKTPSVGTYRCITLRNTAYPQINTFLPGGADIVTVPDGTSITAIIIYRSS